MEITEHQWALENVEEELISKDLTLDYSQWSLHTAKRFFIQSIFSYGLVP